MGDRPPGSAVNPASSIPRTGCGAPLAPSPWRIVDDSPFWVALPITRLLPSVAEAGVARKAAAPTAPSAAAPPRRRKLRLVLRFEPSERLAFSPSGVAS